MAWIQIRLNSTNEKAEQMSDFLEEIGSVSVTFMDSQDTPILSLCRAKRVYGVIPMLLHYLMQKQIWQKLSAY